MKLVMEMGYRKQKVPNGTRSLAQVEILMTVLGSFLWQKLCTSFVLFCFFLAFF